MYVLIQSDNFNLMSGGSTFNSNRRQLQVPDSDPKMPTKKNNKKERNLFFRMSIVDYFRDPKSVKLRDRVNFKGEDRFDFIVDPSIAEAAATAAEGATVVSVVGRTNDVGEYQEYSGLFVPSEVVIKIINPKPECKYSVTVVSANKYTGSAKFVQVKYNEFGTRKLLYSWRPVFPGSYEVLVHEIIGVNHPTPLVDPGRYPIFIKEGPAAGAGLSLLEERIEGMPPCQSVPVTSVYSHWDGDWLGPEFKLADSLRTGWSFLPSRQTMNCKVETFSSEMITAIPQKKKIYILGRSVERGVFQSLIDLMLNTKEKERLSRSTIGTCWGRAMVSKGNLEIMYQDYRVNMFEDPTKPRFVECHNERIIKDPGTSFIHNATLLWEEIFNRDKSEWPDVIYMVTGLGFDFRGELNHQDFAHHLQYFVDHLPPKWKGAILLSDYTFSASTSISMVVPEQYQRYLHNVANLLDRLNDPRIRWFDGLGIAKEMRMYGQNGPDRVGDSQHFHHSCAEKSVVEPDFMTVVCSNITEMVAQVLLGHALGPKVEFVEQMTQKQINKGAKAKMRWCHACPHCMLPFSLIPFPEMECKDGPLDAINPNLLTPQGRYKECFEKGDQGNGAANKMTCPADCLETDFVASFKTESDTVFVRHCPLV